MHMLGGDSCVGVLDVNQLTTQTTGGTLVCLGGHLCFPLKEVMLCKSHECSRAISDTLLQGN